MTIYNNSNQSIIFAFLSNLESAYKMKQFFIYFEIFSHFVIV